MKSAELPPWPAGSAPDPAYSGEEARAEILRAYGIESLEDDPELVAVVKFAAHLCETEVALITWLEADVQRFVARHGIEVRETPREISFCSRTMMVAGLTEVRDLSHEPGYADHALVTGPEHVRFYAGQPLISGEGAPLGALCVVDRQTRPEGLTPLQREGLRVLADAVMQRLRSHRIARAAQRELDASEAYLHILADSIPAIAWSATPEGHFDYFNQRMIDFTGLPDDQRGTAFHPEDWKKASARWERSLKTGEIYEVEHRLRRHDGEYRWMISRALPVRDANGNILRWFGTAVDIHDIYEASEARELIAKELSHRIKNIFAVVAGLVSLSSRNHPEVKQYAEDLTATIRALGRAHDFVRPIDGATRGHLSRLLEELFAPYGSGEGARVKVSGDELPISTRTATPLALVFHELATNSAKYGALASGQGRVTLKIADKGETVKLLWREKGGKPPKKLPKEGFGSRLVDMSVRQLGGSWKRKFDDGGLVVEMTLPKKSIAS
ncbi:MAG TPA: PAS domain-containing protein [Croceibacterium sp.]|jgi:PAS domain S-box-containing protein